MIYDIICLMLFKNGLYLLTKFGYSDGYFIIASVINPPHTCLIYSILYLVIIIKTEITFLKIILYIYLYKKWCCQLGINTIQPQNHPLFHAG